MDARIESIAKDGSELLTEYATNVLTAVGKFTGRLLDDVGNLTRGVIDEGSKLVVAATEPFLPEAKKS